MKNYYAILGLKKGADLNEIKRAYREKAKMYHPDRNTHPMAAEAFILVNEAYEMLLNPKTDAGSQIDEEKIKKYYGSSKAGKLSDEERRNEARKRAEKNAQKSFEKFAKSPIYRTAKVMNTALDFFALLFSFFLILIPVLILTNIDAEGREGLYPMLALSAIGVLFLFAYWKFVFTKQDDE